TTAHDDWLELLVEAGPLPPLLLLIAIAMAARASEPHPAAALVALAVCALGDSPFHLPAVCVLVAVIFAALPRERPLARKRLLVLLLGAGGALLLAQSFGGWFASRLTTAARSEMPEGRRKLLERAVRLAPASSEYALELGLARRDAGDLTGALQMLERSVALGGDVASFVALGNVALEAGESPRARAAFEAALARNPGSVRAHTGLGEALRHLGKLGSAEEHVRVALELRPGDLDLRNRLDSLREQRLDDELDSERFGEPNVLGESRNSR
ncbi:MAG TPA: tetratricopeptide repeat protein, partial [Polyangiaceae bacterium]|nr:tetratricopeptide repeat protein [Polyangiaceae bacterium]